MPLFYSDVPGAIQTTNATPNTANDCFFVKPGATRTVWVTGVFPTGRGGGLTAISGIIYRLEKWTSTASSAGTAITPSPNDPGYQAAVHTAAYAAATVTSGTGGPTLLGAFGSGAASPGQWFVPLSALDQGYSLPAAATQSIDVFNAAATPSLNFEMFATTAE